MPEYSKGPHPSREDRPSERSDQRSIPQPQLNEAASPMTKLGRTLAIRSRNSDARKSVVIQFCVFGCVIRSLRHLFYGALQSSSRPSFPLPSR